MANSDPSNGSSQHDPVAYNEIAGVNLDRGKIADALQNGLVNRALLAGALTALDRGPVLTGVLLGALTIKPRLY